MKTYNWDEWLEITKNAHPPYQEEWLEWSKSNWQPEIIIKFDSHEYINDIYEKLIAYCSDKNDVFSNGIVISFKNKNDATLFKLVWC